jgi:magnesium chelatase subunit D
MGAHPTAIDGTHDPAVAAALIAVDPTGLGGIALRAAHDPAVERFLSMLRGLLQDGASLRRMPLHITDSRLLGGLDLAATLKSGRPILERGLLADADGGCILIPMAERLPAATAAKLAAVLDTGEAVIERDGFACRHPARIGIIAVDEGASQDERPPSALLDRLGLHLALAPSCGDGLLDPVYDQARIVAARAVLPRVTVADALLTAFCQAAVAFGIPSLRAPLLAARAARAHAALDSRRQVDESDAVMACRLVLAPRVTGLSSPKTDDEGRENRGCDQKRDLPDPSDEAAPTIAEANFNEIVLEAVRASLPDHLLAQLRATSAARKRASDSSGRAGMRQWARRGRPAGSHRADMELGARLNVVETLRAAAPWQKLRHTADMPKRVQIRREDFRVVRFKHRNRSATIFLVDASGSSALHRLAEAKGAVELLLADCYVRRDQVALIAFRGKGAELVLPPTRSLARAKRSLAGLPGGGGTPVAAGIVAATTLAGGLRRKGFSPAIVLLTDGRANVTRDGEGARDRAEAEALSVAQECRALEIATLLVDTSPVPGPLAARIAREMGAIYLPLPRADAVAISKAIRGASQGPQMR